MGDGGGKSVGSGEKEREEGGGEGMASKICCSKRAVVAGQGSSKLPYFRRSFGCKLFPSSSTLFWLNTRIKSRQS